MKALDYYKTLGNEEECYKRIHVLASDISSSVISRASTGKYGNTAMRRGLPSDFLELYFRKADNEWIISDKVKNLITFRQFNLKEPYFEAFGPFDIIFLRNIIIYFTNSFKTSLFDRIARLMSPGGYMFLGSGETVNGYSDHFDMLEHQGAIYYRLKR
jgi:chemotaxis protein methyltransferase CheR